MQLADFVPWLFSKEKSPLVTLSIQRAGGKPQRVALNSLPTVIGRSPEADLCLADNWVSRIHCCLDVSAGRLLIRDTESRHGTLVNGRTIRSCELKIGDKVSIGMSTIEILDIADRDCSVMIANRSHQ